MPIARVALPVAATAPFDYWAPDGLDVTRGSVVRVALGSRNLVGVVTEIAPTSVVARDKLQPLRDVVGVPPIADDVLDLTHFVASYYQSPLGLALALAVPPLTTGDARRRAPATSLVLTPAGRAELPDRLRRAPAARTLFERLRDEHRISAEALPTLPAHQKRTLREWRDRGYVEAETVAGVATATARELNGAQAAAVEAIASGQRAFTPFLLFGITGSGKTDVYLAAAGRVIAAGGQVLLLVPEINLTPQLTQRIGDALPGVRVATLHSGLATGDRQAQWRAAGSGEAQLVVGTRLAVFAPLPSLQLVVVDEEHDGSYKQQDNVRYHARDAAVWRAHRLGIPVVLGSATPSLETWLHARERRYRRLDLPHRADPRATLPRMRLVPSRAAHPLEGIGVELRSAIAARLSTGEQSLVFVNRRGFAPSLICASCRWEAQCPRCSARLTTHRTPPLLRCHHCGHAERVPRACPSCGNVDLVPLGHGTQRLERSLADSYPDARVARVDRDSTRTKGAFAAVRDQVSANTLDILVGTQMLAKGHDFPQLTLVGVLGADNALYSADFRATERLAALLMQVAGRAGRAGLPGEVIVQTDFPAHPVYAALTTHDYERFATILLAERSAAQLPPYVHVALLAADAHRRTDVDAFLGAAHAAGVALASAGHADVELFSPVPALLARRAGFERGQIVVQSARRASLQRFLTAWREALDALPGRRARWMLDVDPAGFG